MNNMLRKNPIEIAMKGADELCKLNPSLVEYEFGPNGLVAYSTVDPRQLNAPENWQLSVFDNGIYRRFELIHKDVASSFLIFIKKKAKP